MRRSIVLLMMLGGLLLQSAAAAPVLEPVTLLSATGVNSHNPRVDVDGNVAVAVWEQWDGGTAATAKIWRRFSTDGGKTWSPRRRVYRFGDEQHAPDVAVAGNNVYVVFSMRVGSESHIEFAYSTNGGRTFNGSNAIGFGFGPADILDDSPRVSAHGNKVYTAWANGDVYGRRSVDGGVNFDAPLLIEASASVESTRARIASDGSNVYVLYEATESGAPGPELWFQKSTDAAASFGAVQELSAADDGQRAEIAAYGRRIAIVWEDTSGTGPVMVRTSSNRGGSFTPAATLGSGAYPSVTVTRHRSHAAWAETAGVVSRGSNFAGTTWGPARSMTSATSVGATAIAGFGKNVFFAWTELKGQRLRAYGRLATY